MCRDEKIFSARSWGIQKQRHSNYYNSVWSSGNELLNGFSRDMKTNTKRSLVEKRFLSLPSFFFDRLLWCRRKSFAIERHSVRNWKFHATSRGTAKTHETNRNTYKTQWKATVIQLNLLDWLAHTLGSLHVNAVSILESDWWIFA